MPHASRPVGAEGVDREQEDTGWTVGCDGAPLHVWRCPDLPTFVIGADDPQSADDTPGAANVECACRVDLTGDGIVDFDDIVVLLSQWGACKGECTADLNTDCIVNFQDLLLILGGWGPCEEV